MRGSAPRCRRDPLRAPAEAHLRSTFRDWAGRTNLPSEITEMALAHAVRDKTEAAYN